MNIFYSFYRVINLHINIGLKIITKNNCKAQPNNYLFKKYEYGLKDLEICYISLYFNSNKEDNHFCK